MPRYYRDWRWCRTPPTADAHMRKNYSIDCHDRFCVETPGGKVILRVQLGSDQDQAPATETIFVVDATPADVAWIWRRAIS